MTVQISAQPTYDERRLHICSCGRQIQGECHSTASTCPFGSRLPARQASHFGMVLGRPDSDGCIE